jgi:hypothetical protein
MNRKTTICTLLFIALLVAGILSFGGLSRHAVTSVSAQGTSLQNRDLTLADITGKYAYQATGTYGPNSAGIPVGTPFAANALLTINADGSYTTTGWQSFGGATSSVTSTGTVTTVNANGTGKALDAGGVIEYYFVVADGGKELKLLAITPGIIIAGEAHRL